MPDIYGEPLLSDEIGTAESCTSCGGSIPTPDNLGISIYENSGSGWEQLCNDCSPSWNSINNGETGEDITP